MDNYYQKLGVTADISPEDLKKRFEKRIKGYLLFGLNSRKVKKIEQLKIAFENLIDPALRNKHDLSLSLYQPNEQAPWRNYYEGYSSQSLSQDLRFSEEVLTQVVEKVNSKSVSPALIAVLFAVLFGLMLLLVGLINHQFASSPKVINLQGASSSSLQTAAADVFNKEEQVLFNELSPIKKQDFLVIYRQIDALKQAANFPQSLNSCKIHLEAVSLAEELIIKYQGLLSCLQTVSKL